MIRTAINQWFDLGGEGDAQFLLIRDGKVFGTYFSLRTFTEAIEKYEYDSITVKEF